MPLATPTQCGTPVNAAYSSLERGDLRAADERGVGDDALEAGIDLFGHLGVGGFQVDERECWS